MHWKVARDPFLGPLAARGGDQVAYDAGFFLDEDSADAPLDDVDWRCTPLPLHESRGSRPIALLATGGFCPVHAGHLAMMAVAREAAERAGFEVVAGYLSPGHDAYVTQKCGLEAIPASERLRLCAAQLSDSDWLLVDPWEALHRRVAVNYTDVVARLRTYLRAHHDPKIDVFYVCGGDNARFATAFSEDAGCVVVARPGYGDELVRWRDQLGPRSNLLWCDAERLESSRELRAGPWQDGKLRRVALRLEDSAAAPLLAPERFTLFQRELMAMFAEFASVRVTPLSPAKPSQARSISLDAMLPGDHALAISRLFALGGYQCLGHVARPGSPPVAAQVRALPPGDYVLRDDDSVSGGTLRAARALLPESVRITGLDLALEREPDEEVVDTRDFLLGAREAGLVVQLAGGLIGRVPYLLPYVDPAVRSNVPPALTREFSRRGWLLNERVFHGTGLCVRDLPAAARLSLAWLGEQRPLEEVARFHAERLGRG